jgi:hypothetical protein
MPTARANGGRNTRNPKAATPSGPKPTKFTYALKQWSMERRESGWFVSPTTLSLIGNKPEWRGPFETIESACLAIARALALELADRHTRSVETHKIRSGQPLWGFKPTTRLNGRKAASVT